MSTPSAEALPVSETIRPMRDDDGDPGHAPARRTHEKAGHTPLPIVRYHQALATGPVRPVGPTGPVDSSTPSESEGEGAPGPGSRAAGAAGDGAPGKEREHPVVFLVDVDNTLLDNDRVQQDLREFLAAEVGRPARDRYWAIFEALRAELGYADYLGALQRYRVEQPHDPRLLKVSSFLVDYPFAERLYPGALDVLARFRRWGPTVILSDGDVVFQPLKVERSGLSRAVRGHVLIYVHKELELEDVARRYPARRYVFVDDKVRLLAAFKAAWGERVCTVFPRQGHYAHDPRLLEQFPPQRVAAIGVERIADLLALDLDAFLADGPAQAGAPAAPAAPRPEP